MCNGSDEILLVQVPLTTINATLCLILQLCA